MKPAEITTAEEFIDWLMNRYDFKNKTASVEYAANMLGVTNDSVWKWLSGNIQPQKIALNFMAYIVSHPPETHHKRKRNNNSN